MPSVRLLGLVGQEKVCVPGQSDLNQSASVADWQEYRAVTPNGSNPGAA
ncbi:MAG: hypothetical protein HN530_08395 [Gammaproteobacteria bacterium]|nr:hypothetical protein [Gammaproteobacteria bacterium]